MATLRREIRIHRSANDVWTVVGRPELLHLWFPGVFWYPDARGDRHQ